jgi:hypothetical protein
MVAPPAGQEPSGGQVQEPSEPAEAIETLAPLPEVVEGVEEEVSSTLSDESIDVNDVRWTLLQAVELGDGLESESDEVPDLVAAGRLIGLRFEVENLGEEPLTFVGIQVVDAQGREYTYLSEALPFIIDEEACQMEDLEAGTAITCTALYDVAQDASGLQGVLTDLSLLGGEEILVDLELD